MFTLELMRKAFAGYIEAIGADEDVQGAWDFALHVGGTDALLEQWRGTRKHEISIQEDHDGAEDVHPPQSTSHDSEVLDHRSRPAAGHKRKRHDLNADGLTTSASDRNVRPDTRLKDTIKTSHLDSWITSIQGGSCPQELQVGKYAKDSSSEIVTKIIQAMRGNTAIHALYFQGMGVNDEQLIALLEVLQTTRVYALNMGETNLTLRGLLALKRLLPHTTITALYIVHTPHKIL